MRPAWQSNLDVVERMSETRREIVQLLGLNMGFLNQLAFGQKPVMSKVRERVRMYNDKSTTEEEQQAQQGKGKRKRPPPKKDDKGLTHDHKVVIAQRLWAALICCDIVQEVPSPAIAARWSVELGMIQSLQAQVATFGGMVNLFCEKLDYWELRLLVMEYQERVQFGFSSKCEERNLKPFFKLGHNVMTKTIARVLDDAGINVEQLAQQKAEELQLMLSDSKPFQMKSVECLCILATRSVCMFIDVKQEKARMRWQARAQRAQREAGRAGSGTCGGEQGIIERQLCEKKMAKQREDAEFLAEKAEIDKILGRIATEKACKLEGEELKRMETAVHRALPHRARGAQAAGGGAGEGGEQSRA